MCYLPSKPTSEWFGDQTLQSPDTQDLHKEKKEVSHASEERNLVLLTNRQILDSSHHSLLLIVLWKVIVSHNFVKVNN